MKTFKKIIHWKLTIIVMLLFPVVVFTLITAKTNVINGIQSFVVLTGSMSPTIPQGSLIYTKQHASYSKGSIIAFKRGDVNVTHRIVAIKKQQGEIAYQTKGDANNTIDEQTVLQKDVLGTTVFYFPYIGSFIQFLQTPKGFFGLIIFPTVVFIVLELWNMKKEIEKEVEKRVLKKMQGTQS